MKLLWITLALLAWIATAAAQQAAPSAASSSPGSMLSGRSVPVVPIPPEVLASEAYRSLVADLRQGGFVIYLRHAVTDTTPEPVVRDLTSDGRRQAAAIGARLAAPPPSGANIVLVGHSPTMKEASGVELPEGQAAVVRPVGDGTFRIMARRTEAGIMPAP